jgi:hypothetical protein
MSDTKIIIKSRSTYTFQKTRFDCDGDEHAYDIATLSMHNGYLNILIYDEELSEICSSIELIKKQLIKHFEEHPNEE